MTLTHAGFVRSDVVKIRDIFAKGGFTLSFEVFPPKREGSIEELYEVIETLKEWDPSFISVTYGAGGSTREKTVEIASTIKNELGAEVLTHLTCVQSTRDDIEDILDELKGKGIENILALRGDPPEGTSRFVRTEDGFGYASELVEFIGSRGEFSIGVAGYPEGHIEAPSLAEDLINLKRKVDAGADFITTQLFFNNEDFYRFRDDAKDLGIDIPIIPGIFPIFNYKQIDKMTSMCGAKVPPRFHDKLRRVSSRNEEVEKYGIEHAILQTEDLLDNDVSGLHFYSMNRSSHVIRILSELSLPKRS